MKRLVYFFLINIVCSIGCRKAEPSPGWDEFDSGHIDQELSQKGPLGNYRIVFTQNEKGFYTKQKLVNFAESRGWRLRSVEKIDSAEMSFIYEMFTGIAGVKKNGYPAWFKGNNTYYAFYAKVRPKDDHAEQLSNEVIVSADKSSLCGFNVAVESAANGSKK